MASPQIFEDLSSVFSILLQKKSEHTFLYYPLFQDYLNLLTLVFANLLNDYKKVVQLEEMREFRFMPDSMCMNPSEFTEELCKFANKKHLNLVITKEGMYPEFTIDGIEYEAEREFSRYGAVIHCHMKYFDEIVPLEMPKKKYKQMSMFHKLLPLAIVAIVLVLLVIIRFEDVGNWADKSVIIIGALVEIFVFHRYYYNMEE